MHGNIRIFTEDKAEKVQTIKSLEVAEMVGKRHTDLMRDIRRYSDQLTESKIALSDFLQKPHIKIAPEEHYHALKLQRKAVNL